MKQMRVMSIFLLGLLNFPLHAALPDKICRDGIDGLPITDFSGISCQINMEIREWQGEPLARLSQDLISAIRVEADIHWPTQKNLQILPRKGQIFLKIPSQQIQMSLAMPGAADFNASIKLAPSLSLRGSSVCELEVEQLQLHIEKVTSSLEPWLNQSLMDSFNSDEQIIQGLRQVVDSEIQKLKAETCQLADAPTPPGVDFHELQEDMEALRNKYQRYLWLSEMQLDQNSWPVDTHCDGLLFTSLLAVAGGSSPVGLAEDPWLPGRYFRHWQQNCYANYQNGASYQASKSTISRDMLMGLAHWLWAKGDNRRIDDFIRFGETNSLASLPLIWIVGEGQAGRTDLTPALMQSFYEMHEKLNGTPLPPTMANYDFQVWGPCDGYHCHLSALHMLLRWRIRGELDEFAIARLRWMVHREPHNALYAAIYGLVTRSAQAWPQALRTLLNPRWFPDDRLPSSKERCSFYLFERDYLREGIVSQDWRPCPERGQVFSGIDFLFASTILLEGFEQLQNR
ncbi:MAG: hypothetical protein ACOH5I_24085 [Oligoflexus sp.]